MQIPDFQTEVPHWFIMTSLEPKRTEERLKEENVHRIAKGYQPFQFFIPYQFLLRRHTNGNRMEDDGEAFLHNPKSKASVTANNEIRSALRTYIFIKADPTVLQEFVAGEWNRWVRNRLQYYLDRNRRRVTVSERMMQQFIDTCTSYREQFELWPSIEGIEKNEEIVLNTTPFRGERAYVLEVVHDKRGGISLTVGINLFSGTMLLRLPNIREKDIIRSMPDTPRFGDDHLIDNTQRRLLDILSRRINRSQDEATQRRDIATLDQLYNYRYHTMESDAAHRHLLALMLICAHLRHDHSGRTQLTRQALQELDAINAKGEARASTDIRAYLHAALYIATGNPAYRNEAKRYVQQNAPKSAPLRRLISLIRKRQKI